MNFSISRPDAQALQSRPDPVESLPEAYLRCLVVVGQACDSGHDAQQVVRAVVDLLVEHCPDILAAAAYRATADGLSAELQADAGDESSARLPRVIDLSAPFAWPVTASPESVPGASGTTHSCVATSAPDAPSTGCLVLYCEGPDTEARILFVGATARCLGAVQARAASQEETRRRADALERREQAVSDYLGRISNEFRTPLTLLLAPLESAADRYDDTTLKMALRHARRLRRLSDVLLDLSHVEAGRVEPVLVPVDIAAMTRDIAAMFHELAVAAGVALAVDCPALPQAIYVDRSQWEQVVINLLGHAIRCAAKGEVGLSLRAHAGLMSLEVTYSGRGFDDDALGWVFDRFHLAAAGEEVDLGLALARELVRLHGGDLDLRRLASGSATRLRACLPMLGKPARPVPHRHYSDVPIRIRRGQPADAIGWAVPTPAQRWVAVDAVSAAVPRMRERVVVVIDHGDLRDYVTGLLEPHYRVQSLSTATDGLRAVTERSPDLLLVDLGREAGGSNAFMRGLRASEAGAAVPAILLSSDIGEFAHAGAIESGADDVIDKPFVASELLMRVAAHMRLSGERRALHRRLVAHNLDLESQVASRTAALSESEAQFRAISNLAPDILWRADAQGRTDWRNEAWTRFTGDDGTADDLAFVHPDDRDAVRAWVRDTVSGRSQVAHEYRLRHRDGSYRWFIARMAPMANADGQVERWFGSAADIERNQSARRALEVEVGQRTAALARAAALQAELLHRLSRSQEDERRRIARELHDSLGQYLAALKLALTALAPAVADPALRDRVAHLDALTTAVDRELDDIIAALRPVVLDELGLARALPGIVADWSRQSGIEAQTLLVQVQDARFDEESESAMYRVAQESLTNVVKHANARRVEVTLARRQDELCLTIEDDGIGFDPALQAGGWGLRGMAERARGLGGFLEIESSPDAGTTVLMRLPCRLGSAGSTTPPVAG